MVAFSPPRQPMMEDARRALTLLTNRWYQFSDLRALAMMQVDDGKSRQRFSGALLVKAPTSFRFEVFSPLGQPMMLMTIHDRQLTTFDVATNTATIEPATAETAAQLMHLAIEVDDLVALFAGRAVPPKDLRVAQVLAPDAHGPSLEMTGPLNTQRVWMDFKTGIVDRVQITGGRVEALVTYLRAGDGSLTGFDFTAAQSRVTGSVRYHDAVAGTGIEPERFVLTIPPGATIRQLR